MRQAENHGPSISTKEGVAKRHHEGHAFPSLRLVPLCNMQPLSQSTYKNDHFVMTITPYSNAQIFCTTITHAEKCALAGWDCRKISEFQSISQPDDV